MKMFVKSSQAKQTRQITIIQRKKVNIWQKNSKNPSKSWRNVCRNAENYRKSNKKLVKQPITSVGKCGLEKKARNSLRRKTHIWKDVWRNTKKGLEIHKTNHKRKKLVKSWRDSQIHLCSAVCCCLPA